MSFPGISTGGGGLSNADNGHMSTGNKEFGPNAVYHAPVNIGGSTINDNKIMYALLALAAVGAYVLLKKKGRK